MLLCLCVPHICQCKSGSEYAIQSLVTEIKGNYKPQVMGAGNSHPTGRAANVLTIKSFIYPASHLYFLQDRLFWGALFRVLQHNCNRIEPQVPTRVNSSITALTGFSFFPRCSFLSSLHSFFPRTEKNTSHMILCDKHNISLRSQRVRI